MHSLFTFSELSGSQAFAVHWLLQSTLLLGVGLFLGRLLESRGSAVQSAVYRTTLVAALLCPLATSGLSQVGLSGWSLLDIEEPSRITVTEFIEPIATPPLPTPKVETLPATGVPLQGVITPNLKSFVTPPARQPVTRFAIAVAVVSLISTTLLLRLALAWWRLARLRRQAVSANSETLALCRELAETLKVPAPVVFCSPYVPSPCLAGIRRPAVLLPEEKGQLSMRDVLVHELAHLRRHDCHWNLLRRATTALFWFQPLLWKLSSRLEATAEEVCDDFVVQYGANRQEYAHRLVDIAELSLAPIAAAGVGMVSLRSMLAQRVARILDTSRKLSTQVNSRLLALVLVGGLVGTMVVGLVGVGSQALQAETGNENTNTNKPSLVSSPTKDAIAKRYECQLVDIVSGRPIAGATVTVKRRTRGGGKSFKEWPIKRNTDYTTDAKGRYTIDFRANEVDKPRLYVEISTRHPEYVNYYGGYSYSMIKKNLKMGSKPFFATLEIWPATEITGAVVAPDGKPVLGLKVSGYSKFSIVDVHGRGSWLNSRTNDEGIFQLKAVRGGKTVIWFSPKEYSPSTHVLGSLPAELGKTALDFLKLHPEWYSADEAVATRDLGKIFLEHGIAMQGQVVDVGGKAMEGVWVNAELHGGPAKKDFGHDMNLADPIVRSALTDVEGRYRLGPLPSGIYSITPKDEPREQAIADRTPRPLPAEFFPKQVTLEEGTQSETVDFRAVPHVTLVAQYYRSSGEPRSGNEMFLVGKHKETFYSKRCRPDANGRIEVFAPVGLQEAMLDVFTNEHSSLRHRLTKDGPLINETTIRLGTLTADVEEIAIIRYVAPILLIKAVDEEGTLIEDAWVTLMYAPGRAPHGGGQYIRNGRNAGHVSLEGNGDGRWRSSQLLPDEEFTLTVEAKGYESYSQKLNLSEGETREVVIALVDADLAPGAKK